MVDVEQVTAVMNEALLVGLTIDERYRSLLPSLRQVDLEIRESKDLFPNLGIDGLRVVTNFEQIATSAIDPARQYVEYDLPAIKRGIVRYLCCFWPNSWVDDLKCIGVRPMNIEFLLYQQLNNKLTQVNILNNACNSLIVRQNSTRKEILSTSFRLIDQADFFDIYARTGDFVISAQISNGGSGTFRVRDYADYATALARIETPIIRVERFVESLSFTHFGIIFETGAITFPPQFQAIKDVDRHLRYVGASFGVEKHLPDNIVTTMHDMTLEIGRGLSKLGYRGAFGCDYIYAIEAGELIFVELNPRFVGETYMYSKCVAEAYLDLPDKEALCLDPIFLHIMSTMFDRRPDLLEAHLDERRCIKLPFMDHKSVTSQLVLSLGEMPQSTESHSSRTGLPPRRFCLFSVDDIISDHKVPVSLHAPLEALIQRTQPAMQAQAPSAPL